jgi:hypothetical protein
MRYFRASPATLQLCAAMALMPVLASSEDSGLEFFEKRVRPVLMEHCQECHGEEKDKGGLRLDSREALLRGGDSGAAIVPGNPDESLLINAVRHLDKDLKMPPDKNGAVRKLPAAVIADLAAWVKMGAPDPRTGAAAQAESKPGIDYAAARRSWAYSKPQRPEIPQVENAAWPRNSIDRFILAKLEAKQLKPAAEADRRTLLRRVTFNLTGLPPTPEEVQAFLADESPDAFAKVVDRLLESPRYGERWARHWLDVVRYTDSFDSRITTGDGRKMDCSEAWRYRDWVVDALNRDLPYDEFIRQQVAGDIMASQPGGKFDPQKIVATGVYAIGNWGGGDADKEKLITDIADDQVDLTARAFLGLTVACARCHDHKFDPISTEDYYGLAGIFFSSHILPNPGPKTNGPEMLRIPLLSPAERALREKAEARLKELDRQLNRAAKPFTETKRDIHGKPGLHAWHATGSDNPALVINTTDSEVSFLTIKLPAKTISLHPGPKTAVSAVWRSPLNGVVTITARLRDADPNCGDGVTWDLRAGGQTLRSETLENGGEGKLSAFEIRVQEGQLVRLVVDRRGEYTCDSTEVDMTVAARDGGSWNLREALLAGANPATDEVWRVYEGDGGSAQEELPDEGSLKAERDQLSAKLATPVPVAHGLQEGGCPQSPHEGTRDVRVHVRGRYDRLGPVVPRSFPKVLAGENQAPLVEGSGRLALAHWLSSPSNPLTARVMVNRVWQHHFGEGIVRTPNNFGKLGEAPTHPELLDWLADEFVRSGWSLKALHRLILLSSTYQQDSKASQETVRADAENKLFSRMNRRRLESEAIRDALLQAAGKLDFAAGGPAFRDLQLPRRTLYLMTIRSDRANYQSLFDAADPTSIAEKRIDSTVAPQALFLLNHPLALIQAESLAKRVEAQAPSGTAERVRWLYELLYSRQPTDEEVRLSAAMLQSTGSQGERTLTWEQYAHALLCANEFVYID